LSPRNLIANGTSLDYIFLFAGDRLKLEDPTYEICDRIESDSKRCVLKRRLPLSHSRMVGSDRHLGRKPCKIRKSLIQIAAAKESIHLNLASIEAS